jgi:hypothetical protein
MKNCLLCHEQELFPMKNEVRLRAFAASDQFGCFVSGKD